MKKRANIALTFLSEYFGFMVIGLLVGLYMANYDQELYKALLAYNAMNWLGEHLTIEFLLRESVITGFFGLIIAHILVQKVNGDFSNRSSIMQPIWGAIGGVVFPIAIYISLVLIFGFSEAIKAFPVVAATDIAFSLLVARINHDGNSKTVTFLKLLAIADDIIIILLSIFLPNPDHPFNAWGLLLIVGIMGLSYLLFKKINIPKFQLIIAIGLGAAMWNALLYTGLHPILAFVLVLPFAIKSKPQQYEASGRKAMKMFESIFKIPVDIGLFGFGFVSGGIYITGIEMIYQPFTLIIVISIVVGKAVGIPLAARIAKGDAYTKREQIEAGFLGGVGFTVAILMAQMLLKDQPILREQATIGAVLSLFVVAIGNIGIFLWNWIKE
jgi:NhaA family Na+:H+ antiporter